MITKSTIDQIIDTARIEEVVGEFVTLKKRGANLLGLCPFHNEKTPSFTVSPAKGIYKCFGCGKAGSAVNFIMEHEHYNYPEALRFLANKYNIEIEEEFSKIENEQEKNEKESLFIISAYAQEFYSAYLWSSEEGKSTGLTYFEERGFDEKTINKFQLGFAPSSGKSFTELALKNAYLPEYLVKSGLSIQKEGQGPVGFGTSENTGREGLLYDRFRGRVIFPIHNLTGRVIAFGARIIQKDPKAPKYINSPETDIYNKSKILYGIYYAKKSIIEKDECYLVEGYTDVISMHKEGIENVVASSGTSLTVEQIKLIGRFTKNITVLYDGDEAGIKASMRGIDLILEEGLNVKVVLFPGGDDPDSFARRHSHSEIVQFLNSNKQDFIKFKTSLLLAGVANDPVGKATLIKDIIETISKIPDGIVREMYVKQCSAMMEISEQTLVSELNKIRRKDFARQVERDVKEEVDYLMPDAIKPEQALLNETNSLEQEAEIIRILLNYGNREMTFTEYDEKGHTIETKIKARDLMLNELMMDGIGFDDDIHAGIFSYFSDSDKKEYNQILDELKNHNQHEIRNRAIDMLAVKYELSDWEAHDIYVKTETENFSQAVLSPIYHLKLKRVLKLKRENQEVIKEYYSSDNDCIELVSKQKEYDNIISAISKYLGIVVVK